MWLVSISVECFLSCSHNSIDAFYIAVQYYFVLYFYLVMRFILCCASDLIMSTTERRHAVTLVDVLLTVGLGVNAYCISISRKIFAFYC